MKMTVAEITDGASLAKYLEELRGDNDDLARQVKAMLEQGQSTRAALKSGLMGSLDRPDTVATAAKLGAFARLVAQRAGGKIAELGGGGGLPGLDKDARPHGGVMWEAPGGDFDTKALGTPLRGDSATGSYTVPQEYAKEVLRISEAESELMRLVRRVPMTTRTLLYPTYATGVDFSWPTNETGSISEVNPTFGQETLTARTAALWIAVSEELLEDSAVILGQYLLEIITEAWVRAFETSFLNCTTPWTGLLTDTDVLEARMSAGNIAFADMDLDDLDALIGKLTTKAKRNGAHFVAHPTIIDVLAQSKDANGQFRWAQSAASQPSLIRGYKYMTSDNMPDASESAADTPFLLFGKPNLLVFGDRISLELRYYDGTAYGVQYAEGFFRARVRAGFLVPIPAAFARLRTAAA